MPFDFDRLGNLLLVYGTHFLGAVIVALIGWWMAGKVEGITRRALTSSSRMDPTVGAFLSSLAYYAVLLVTLLVTLQVLGIQATSIVAIVGVASLTIGLALQGTLSNIAAGIMLLIFRPFRLGDSIEVLGKSGTVKNLNLFMTELASDDNVQVLIPNGQVWSAPLINFSVYPTRRVSASFRSRLTRTHKRSRPGYARTSNRMNVYSRHRHQTSLRQPSRRQLPNFRFRRGRRPKMRAWCVPI